MRATLIGTTHSAGPAGQNVEFACTPGTTFRRVRITSRTYIGEWWTPQPGERIVLRGGEALEWEEVAS